MKFLDINTFYGPKAGGIRTYHQAKIEWFSRHPEHDYTLAFPGPKAEVTALHANVRLVQWPGPAVTADPQGYRLLLNPRPLWQWIRDEAPDVIESGDPWLSGPMTLALYRLRFFKGLLSTFYHSDPIPSYAWPWALRGRFQAAKAWAVTLAGLAFYQLQAAYPRTVVSSHAMLQALQNQHIGGVEWKPFGVDPAYFAAAEKKKNSLKKNSDPVLKLLYAGRLDAEKGWDILWPLLDRILQDGRFSLTIAGRGRYSEKLAAKQHARYRFVGFVAGHSAMADLYAEHDVLLAPGPYETFGLGVLEAMASGLPVIGPDRGGAGELLSEAQSPFIFRAGEVDDFWARLNDLRSDALPAISASQAQLAQRYGTWEQAIGRLVSYYAESVRAGVLR